MKKTCRSFFWVYFVTSLTILLSSSVWAANSIAKDSKEPKKILRTEKDGWIEPEKNYKWITTWSKDSQLNIPRASSAVVAANGFIYVIGGGDPFGEKNEFQESVEFTKIRPDGSLEPWKMTSAMSEKRMHAAAVEANGWIYVIGGEKGARFEDLLNTVEKSKIQPDGSLGPWTKGASMSTPRRGLVASYYKGWIYAFGGFNGTFLKDILQSRVNADGVMEEWIWDSNDAKNNRYIHSGVIHNNNVYLFGGHVTSAEKATNTAEWNSIDSKGKLGLWSDIPNMKVPRFGSGAVVLRNTVYLLGGENTISLTSVEKGQLTADGKIKTWIQETPLPEERVGLFVTAWNDVIYVIGGFSQKKYLKDVTRAYYSKGKSLGIWTNDKKIISQAVDFTARPHPDALKHYDNGYSLFTKGRMDEAVIDFKHAIDIAPESGPPYFLLGVVYEQKGVSLQALEQYRIASKLMAGDLEVLSRLANLAQKQGLRDEAIMNYLKILNIKPEFEEAKIRLIQLLIDAGQCNEASLQINSLKKIKPDEKTISDMKAKCSSKKESVTTTSKN